MEATRVQTGLRLKPALIARLKRKARKNNQTFNGYVEQLLESATETAVPQLSRAGFMLDQEFVALGKTIPAFTKEEIERDPKLAYLLGE